MRIGEGLALQYKDIDEEERTNYIQDLFAVKVRDGDNSDDYEWQLTIVKTYARRRVAELYEEARKALKAYKDMKQPECEEDFIITTMDGSLLYPNNLREKMQSILINVKIEKKIDSLRKNVG